MPSSHLILCRPLLLLPPIRPSMIVDTILGLLDLEEIPAGSLALLEAALCKAHPGSDFGSQAPTVLMISQVGFLAFSGTCQARG